MAAPAWIIGGVRIPMSGDVVISGPVTAGPLPAGDVAPYHVDFGVAPGTGGGGLTTVHGATHGAGAGDPLNLNNLAGPLNVPGGGLGLTTIPAGALPYAAALDVIAALAVGADGHFLKVVAGLPAWSAIDAGDVASGQFVLARMPRAAVGKLIRAIGAGADPAYSTFSIADTFPAGSMPYASALDVLTALAAPGSASVLTHTVTGPVWVAALAKSNQHAQSAYYDGTGPFTADQSITRTGANAILSVTRASGATVRVLASTAEGFIGTLGAHPLTFQVGGNSRWQLNASGHLVAVTDAAFDLGDATHRPRDLFLSRNATIGNQLTSQVATGVSPFVVASTTLVSNLTSQYLGASGQDSAYHLALLNATGTLATSKGGTGADGSALAASRFLASPSGGAGAATYRALAAADLPAEAARLDVAGRFTGAISGAGATGVSVGLVGGIPGFYFDTGGDSWSVAADAVDLRFEHDSGLALALTADGAGGGGFTGGDYLGANIYIDAGVRFQVAGAQVVGARKTGWATATGTAERTTFATYTAPAISNPPTQAQVQAIADHLQIISRRFKAWIDDAHATAGHGLIGT